MVKRTWPVVVIQKTELPKGFFTVTLREPAEADYNRPYWVNRAHDGGPLSLNVTAEEYRQLAVDDVLTITLEQEKEW